jgi:hypothetical protein
MIPPDGRIDKGLPGIWEKRGAAVPPLFFPLFPQKGLSLRTSEAREKPIIKNHFNN